MIQELKVSLQGLILDSQLLPLNSREDLLVYLSDHLPPLFSKSYTTSFSWDTIPVSLYLAYVHTHFLLYTVPKDYLTPGSTLTLHNPPLKPRIINQDEVDVQSRQLAKRFQQEQLALYKQRRSRDDALSKTLQSTTRFYGL